MKSELATELASYEVIDFAPQAFYSALQEAKDQAIRFEYNNETLDIVLHKSDILSPNFVSQVNTATGLHTHENIIDYTYEGYVVDTNTEVRITSTPTFFSAYFKGADETFYIEPAQRFQRKSSRNTFVVYAEKDVLPTAGTCLAVDTKEWDKTSVATSKKSEGCLEVDYALAADFAMFQKHGSPENILLHVSTVINMVNADYKNPFSKEIKFVVSEQYTSTCPACDPWLDTTKAQDLLKNFDDWGPVGFLNPHDLGSLWTNRNFDGTTVAVAWIGKICTSKRYNCIQDFTTSYASLRMVNSHEIGHNFDAHHDPSGTNFIMTSAVNPTYTDWSAATVAEINAHIASRDCLTPCQQAPATGGVSLKISLEGKLWLQGYFNNQTHKMSNELVSQNILPLSQPFNGAPWNYNGSETITNIPAGTIDWLLLELRAENNPELVVERKAVLINENGEIMDISGDQTVQFDIEQAGEYYVSVHQKSHLRIRTSQPLSFSLFQPTDMDLRYVNSNPLSDHVFSMDGEHAGMAPADFDQNGIINFLDLLEWHGYYNNTLIYAGTDVNGDGQVDLADISFWLDFQNFFTF